MTAGYTAMEDNTKIGSRCVMCNGPAIDQLCASCISDVCEAEDVFETEVLERHSMELMCERIGHDLEDNSYAGPECGYEDVHCNRCGWEHYHVYY